MQLELVKAPAASFITLTYDDEHLPEGGVLVKRDVQLWMKRLRERYPLEIRYFLCGEYGEEKGRPHYHAILYGVPPAMKPLLQSVWGKGGVHAGTVGKGSIQYVCGYILKKMTKKTDKRLDGRPPEFTLMSRRPGIGHGAVKDLVAAYHSPQGKEHLRTHRWIATSTRIGGRIFPLGRYLSNKIVGHLDLTEEDRKRHHQRLILKKFEEKSLISTTEYEIRRKIKVDQQEGKVSLLRASWRRTL